jgi:sugar lactone lactonase YvrE
MAILRRVVLLAVLCFTGPAHAQENGCEPSGGLDFVCGPQNAEDLVLVPGTKWIIASGMAAGAGFYLIDSRAGSWGALRAQAEHDAAFPNCTTPPSAVTLNTHGLNVRPGASGHSTLYVVGHGAREAIEVFDVDANGDRPKLTWKGCVQMPEGLAANSVASFADGSLVATVLLMPGKSFADSIARKPTGAVFEWSPGDRGFELVRGTELPGNNGIEVSADGQEIYVVSSGLQTIVAFSHSNPARQLRSTRPLPLTPDNVHMSADGRLLTAGMKNDEPACGGAPGPQHDLEKLSTCPRGSIALAVDPATMRDAVLVETPANPNFSNATMALTVDDRFWIGTFLGDRVAHGSLSIGTGPQ